MTKFLSRAIEQSALSLVAVCGVGTRSALAQTIDVSLTTAQWEATDSVRNETHLGRSSLYINRGVALASGITLQDGVLEYDIAADEKSSFLGVAFRARALDQSEVVFFRPNDSGTIDAVQYGPALNGMVAAWQVYHGRGANAVADIPRDRWMHVRIELAGTQATLYLDTATTPTLVVPALAGTGGAKLGVWAGAFGHGAWYSNIRYSSRSPVAINATVRYAPGTLVDWELSNVVTPEQFHPERLPLEKSLTWERVRPESNGVVLINRYRRAPSVSPPRDSARHVIADSVMTAKVAGSSIVYARTVIDSPRDELRRVSFGYSDGIVMYLNGEPLVLMMNPQNFRSQGVMDTVGESVFLHLKKGRNELTVAIPELGGGWGFWARLLD